MPITTRPIVESLDRRAMFAAHPVATATPSAAAATPLRVFATGNSLTDGISYGGFVDLLKTTGKAVSFGRQTGTGYSQYDNLSLKKGYFTSGVDPARPTNTNPWGNYQDAFAKAKWDVLTIQPHDRRVVSQPLTATATTTAHDEAEIPNSMQWLRVMAKNNPAGQVFVYSRPARRTDVAGDGVTKTGKTFDYAKEWTKVYDDTGSSNFNFFTQSRTQQIMSRLRKAQRADAVTSKLPEVRLIPVGEAYANVDTMIKAGKFGSTPIKNTLDLYRDQSHPTEDVAAYVIALTFYSSITGKSPIGVTPPEAYLKGNSKIKSVATQRLLQQAVYDALTATAYAGFTTPLGGVQPTPAPTPTPAATGNFRGYVINDKDRDGVWDKTESGVIGRTVWLDLDNDGKLDANEPARRTAGNGVFQFSGLKPGQYTVRTVLPAGVKQIAPAGTRGLLATVSANKTLVAGVFATA